MNLISFLLRRARGTFILAVVFGLLSGASSTGLLSLVGSALTRGRFAEQAGFTGFLALALFAMGMRFLSQDVLSRLHHRGLYAMRLELSRQIMGTPLRRLEELGLHKVTKAFTEDAMLVTFALASLPSAVINATVIVGCLVYLAWLSWTVFLATLGFVAVAGLAYSVLHASAFKRFHASDAAETALLKAFRGVTEGIKELKLNRARRAALMRERIEPGAARLLEASQSTSSLFAVATSWSSFIFFFLVGVLLFVFPRFAHVGLETMVGYSVTIFYLQQPLDSLFNLLPQLGRGSFAMQNIERLSEGTGRDQEKQEDTPLPEPLSFERLELRGIVHTYHRGSEDGRFTLGPMDLTLKRGELLFLVGGNGSGKTTLAKLLAGLYTPEAGEIRLDGEPLTAENLDRYRQHFSAVFFDFHLFDSLLGLAPGALGERPREYLERLHLDQKVRIGPDGALSTTELSQGQRKRLALLTAYLENRPIYIFDEWAADQDPGFKDIFYNQLLPDLKRQGKAVVVISHDNRYFHLADRVIQLDSGQLASPAGEPERQRTGS